ncbi:MAG: glycosyltransferase family 2 protein, partial [Candidatus Kerfeldbacteria bacterium]|nr:glycosyltransferase family 2 protein [Candidatus Kerfeldbacteria bacterium]
TTFCVALLLSFVRPLWAIYFIIIFDVFWLVRVVYLTFYVLVSYRRFAIARRKPWRAMVAALPQWRSITHLIVIPTYQESADVLRETFTGLLRSDYPLDRCIVVLATEERDLPRATDVGAAIRKEFGSRFASFLVTQHPAGIPDEIAGKGANIAWAGRRAKELIDRLGLRYDQIIVSTFDVDTCVTPNYFSALTYAYLTHPTPTRTSYQPVPLFTNNIWDAPALARIAAHSTTFWMLTEQARPERLFTFSSHSMSFQALVDVGFWQSDIVTEDSRIFLQCLLRYDGDYTVTPLPIAISMDAVRAKSIWRSLVNLYKQQRRWAYGVENFPFMAWHFARTKDIPRATKLHYMWNQLEGVYSWATAPILIFVLGRLPLAIANYAENTSALVQNAPFVLERLMLIAMVGLVPAAILSTILLPVKRHPGRFIRLPLMVLQWLLFPIVMIVFGSIPATDAQTRLMFGRYLNYWTTEKARRSG